MTFPDQFFSVLVCVKLTYLALHQMVQPDPNIPAWGPLTIVLFWKVLPTPPHFTPGVYVLFQLDQFDMFELVR